MQKDIQQIKKEQKRHIPKSNYPSRYILWPLEKSS